MSRVPMYVINCCEPVGERNPGRGGLAVLLQSNTVIDVDDREEANSPIWTPFLLSTIGNSQLGNCDK